MKILIFFFAYSIFTLNVFAYDVVNHGPNQGGFSPEMTITTNTILKVQAYVGSSVWIQDDSGATLYNGSCTSFPVPEPCWYGPFTTGTYHVFEFDGASVFNYYNFYVIPYSGSGGGGGDTSTSTISYNFATSSLIDVTGAFNLASTSISFGAINFSACDVSSIQANPFASSSLSWGTINVPLCFLQSFKFLFFGLDGFDSYRITNFLNTSSSTLPFVMFKFISSGLVYINPVSGELINLPSEGDTFKQDVPFPTLENPTSTISLNFMASSSIIEGIHAPVSVDKTLASIELIFFLLAWGIIFRFINI